MYFGTTYAINDVMLNLNSWQLLSLAMGKFLLVLMPVFNKTIIGWLKVSMVKNYVFHQKKKKY